MTNANTQRTRTPREIDDKINALRFSSQAILRRAADAPKGDPYLAAANRQLDYLAALIDALRWVRGQINDLE